MKRVRLLFIVLIGTALIQSCVKPSDFDFNKLAHTTYTGEWAVPLVTSHITLRDIFKNQTTSLQTDPQGLVTLVYSVKNLASQTADQLMKIPDQNLANQAFSFSTIAPPVDLSTGKQYTQNFTADVPLSPANATQKLDSVYVKSGTIRIPINSTFNKPAVFNIDAPNIIRRTTRAKIAIPAISITPLAQSAFVTVDISDCILILRTVGGVANTIHFNIGMTVSGNTNPTQPSYSYNMAIGITNLQFTALYGNLGNFNMNFNQNVDLSLFKTNLGGGFQFAPGAVSLNFAIDNSFGLPVQFNATSFNAHSDINSPYDVPIKLFGPALPNIIDVASAAAFGQTKTTTIASTNPNLQDAFNLSPTKITLSANATTNPYTAGVNNFVSDKSQINVNMDVMLKLFASINNFTFQDTLNFDLKNADQLENASFRLSSTNGFPLSVKIQAYFTDDNYNVLDAMFTDPLPEMLKPATVSGAPDYKTITPTAYQFPDILYDQTRLQKIKAAKKIILKAVLNTPSNSNIKIYDSYYIDTKIAVRTKAKVQL